MDEFSSKQVCDILELTARQLDSYCRAGLVTPSVLAGQGLGSRRCWSKDDLLRVAVIKHLVNLGYTYKMCEPVAEILPELEFKNTKALFVVSDGLSAHIVDTKPLAAQVAVLEPPVVCVATRAVVEWVSERLS